MDSHIVVGIGNIYASEALYMAGINPRRAAGRVSRQKYALLAEVIREVLTDAIAAGGTTLRDFVNGEGKPGYFRQHLNVYGKAGEPCISCRVAIREITPGPAFDVLLPEVPESELVRPAFGIAARTPDDSALQGAQCAPLPVRETTLHPIRHQPSRVRCAHHYR